MVESSGGIDMGNIKLILGASILLLVSGQVNAAPVLVNTEAEFLSLAGAVITEGFEEFPTDTCETGGASPSSNINTANFSVTTMPQNGGTSFLCTGTTSAGLPGPTEGTNALIAGSNTGDTWILEFTMSEAIHGVYFELTDAVERGDAFLLVPGFDPILVASQGSGGLNTVRFGAVFDSPFTSFSLSNTGQSDGWGIDNMIFAQVPPSALINGGFEEPTGIGTYEHRNGDELPGWNLFSTYKGTVHFDTDYAPVSEGSQAVQIEVPGDWISQSVSTVIGQEYKVSFDLSAYPVYGGPNLGYTPCNPYCDSILEVSVGSASEVFNGSSEEYVTHSLLFTADSAISTVKFENPFILDINDEWGNYPHLDNVSVSMVAAQVSIDIKPGSDPNSINPRSNGVIPVAVLGSIDFDATQVDVTTVTFGPDGASPAHDGHVEDVNDDGFMDAVFHFRTQETGIVCGDTEATLTGMTFGGLSIAGTDTVNTVGCNGKIAEKVDASSTESAGATSWLLLLGLSLLGLLRRHG
jgi:hypothetical protein